MGPEAREVLRFVFGVRSRRFAYVAPPIASNGGTPTSHDYYLASFRVFEALARTSEPLLGDFSKQGLANGAWLDVCGARNQQQERVGCGDCVQRQPWVAESKSKRAGSKLYIDSFLWDLLNQLYRTSMRVYRQSLGPEYSVV